MLGEVKLIYILAPPNPSFLPSPLTLLPPLHPRANKAKVIRLEKEAKEMEKAVESMRHAQAKCVELEKINKKLHTQTHMDRREIIKVREEVEVLKVKASRVDKLQLELNSQRERVEEAGRSSSKLKVCVCVWWETFHRWGDIGSSTSS